MNVDIYDVFITTRSILTRVQNSYMYVHAYIFQYAYSMKCVLVHSSNMNSDLKFNSTIHFIVYSQY